MYPRGPEITALPQRCAVKRGVYKHHSPNSGGGGLDPDPPVVFGGRWDPDHPPPPRSIIEFFKKFPSPSGAQVD